MSDAMAGVDEVAKGCGCFLLTLGIVIGIAIVLGIGIFAN